MDMQKLMQQAQQMQEQMLKAQEDLAKETVEASAGGGMVKVQANGAGEIVSITLSDEAIAAGDKEMLEDVVLAAVNEAHRMANDLAQSRMGAMMPGGLGEGGM